MGISSSRFKRQQQGQQHYPPFPYPPYAFPPGQYPAPPPGFIPQSFVPSGYPAAGPGPAFPQPQVAPAQPVIPTQEPRRRTRRRRRRDSSNSYAPAPDRAGPSFPQPQATTRAPSHATRDERRGPAPLFTPNTNNNAPLTNFPSPDMGNRSARHRAQTPFTPARQMSREDSDDSDDEIEPLRYEQPRDPDPTMRVIEPMDTPPSAVYGPPPSNAPRERLIHPLPTPPRDLYEMSPYKSLFNLPQTTALLTATYGVEGLNPPAMGIIPSLPTTNNANNTERSNTERRRPLRGLFRAFSTSRRDPHPPPPENNSTIGQNVRFVPVFVPVDRQPAAAAGSSAGNSTQPAANEPPQHAAPFQPPSPQPPPASQPVIPPQFQPQSQPVIPPQPPQQQHQPAGDPQSIIPGPPPGTTPAAAQASMSMPRAGSIFAGAGPSDPPPPQAPGVPILRFDQTTQHAGFLNHSPHRILYNNRTYPSATHLHEAMKYIDTRPDVAEIIRNCPNIHDVYPLSARFQQFERSDWGQVFMGVMEEVLFLKFRQHPDLRSLLLKTGGALLKYADQTDQFWGEGSDGNGRNELGKALMKVRHRLIETNYAP